MPQMAPISWLILFFVFSIAFIIFNILNYYCLNKSFLNKENESNNEIFNNTLNWKW